MTTYPRLSEEEADILKAVLNAETFGDAIGNIPENWYLFAGTDAHLLDPAQNPNNHSPCHASIVPPTQFVQGTMLYRTAVEGGFASGHGTTRLEALQAAATRALQFQPKPAMESVHKPF